MPHCPTCDQRAEEMVHFCESTELAAGPAVRICHNTEGAYIHVLDDGDTDDMHGECRICGVDLDEIVPDGMIRPIPYCPADMPTECPACGCEDVGWSAVKMAFVCDNGCDPWRPEA